MKINSQKFGDLLRPVVNMLPQQSPVITVFFKDNYIYADVDQPGFTIRVKDKVISEDKTNVVGKDFVLDGHDFLKLLKLFNNVIIKDNKSSLIFSEAGKNYKLSLLQEKPSKGKFSFDKFKFTVLDKKKITLAVRNIVVDNKSGDYGPTRFVFIKDGNIYSLYSPSEAPHIMTKMNSETDCNCSDEGIFSIYGSYAIFFSSCKESFYICQKKNNLYAYNNNYSCIFSVNRQFDDTLDIIGQIDDFINKSKTANKFISFDVDYMQSSLRNLNTYFGNTVNDDYLYLKKEGDNLNISFDSGNYGEENIDVFSYGLDLNMYLNFDIFNRVISGQKGDIVQWDILCAEDKNYNFIISDGVIQAYGSKTE